jgi:hypothetical protein
MPYMGSNRLFNITSKGDSCFIRYSAHADGTDFTKTWSEGQNYIGIATAQVAPTDKSKYVWSALPKGNPGEKGEKGDPGDKGDAYIITEADKTDIATEALNLMEQAEDYNYGG